MQKPSIGEGFVFCKIYKIDNINGNTKEVAETEKKEIKNSNKCAFDTPLVQQFRFEVR